MRTGIAAAAVVAALAAGAPAFAGPAWLHVAPPAAATQPLAGRLLVFARPLKAGEAAPAAVDVDELDPQATTVAAQDAPSLDAAGVDVDLDLAAYPHGFSTLAPGRYAVQAVLDRGMPLTYAGRGEGDIASAVAVLDWPGQAGAVLTLERTLPAPDPFTPSPRASAAVKAAYAPARADIHALDFQSPALTAFWGRPTALKGWVVTPPGYAAGRARYPTVYFTHGFGGSAPRLYGTAVSLWEDMRTGAAPPMIWVLLDQSSPTGTHEFADGVNNGPWGAALTAELIPDLERRWRMDGRASGRFLTGHSSGGWATLWLQVRYPKLFGGTWSTSPDASDFHDFTGIDIYAPDANAYRRPDGSPTPLGRVGAKEVASFQALSQLEAVEGAYGGQISSFDWVFSPRGPDGRPQPLFDRATGRVDPAVAAYWRDRYDIAHILQRDWRTLRPDLDGKVHVIIGHADTFHLDGAADRVMAVLDGLGAKAEVRFIPGRSHFDLFREGDDEWGLLKRIAWSMNRIARPAAAVPARFAAPPPAS